MHDVLTVTCPHTENHHQSTFKSIFMQVFTYLQIQLTVFKAVTPSRLLAINHPDLFFLSWFYIFFYFLLRLQGFIYLFIFLLLSFLPSCSSCCSSYPPTHSPTSVPHWQLDYHVSMRCQKLAARENHVLSHPWLLQRDEGQQPMTLGTKERKAGVTRGRNGGSARFHVRFTRP